MKFAALSFVIGISGVAAAPAASASLVDVEGVEGRTAKILPKKLNVDISGVAAAPAASASLVDVEGVEGRTAKILPKKLNVDECKEGMVLVHVAAHPFGKFCVMEDDHCRTLPEDDEKFCRRAGEGSRLSIATSQTKCDASNCGNWDCDAWCKCFNDVDETDGVYADYECEDDDGTDECKCLVDYGKEPFPRTCKKNFFKPTPGRPAHDGTGCQRCTDLTDSCNTNENTIIPCTTTTDAVCKPKKICYAAMHHKWRVSDDAQACSNGARGGERGGVIGHADTRHWTFLGKITVAGSDHVTGCNHVAGGVHKHDKTWHSVDDATDVAEGEYTGGMQMQLAYESWENDDENMCAYTGDQHLTEWKAVGTEQYVSERREHKKIRGWCGMFCNPLKLVHSHWEDIHATRNVYGNVPYTVDGDDCRHVQVTERAITASPKHDGTWQDTTWKHINTEMHIRTKTYRANSCDGCAENFFLTDVTDPDADGAGCKACSDMSFCNTYTHTIIPCTATTDAVCKPKKLCYEIQHYQWRMKDDYHQCESVKWDREWTFKGRFRVNNADYSTACEHRTTSFQNNNYHGSRPGSQRAVGEYKNGMTMTLGYESWEDDQGDKCSYDTNKKWYELDAVKDDCHQSTQRVFTVPRSDGEWRITEYTSGYTSMKVKSKTYYKEGSC